VGQFESLVAENGWPSCEEVKRLLERTVDKEERERLESHLKEESKDLRETKFGDQSSIYDFGCIYLDNNFWLSCANGAYLVVKIGDVETLT